MSDKEIINLYLARDERAIQLTQDAYGRYCRTIAQRILQNNEETEECLNDTWLKAWQTIPPTIPERLGAYLSKIARNLALNRYRHQHQQKREGDLMSMCIDELQESIPAEDTPEKAIEKALLTDLINKFLENLPKDERVMFVRRYFYMDSVAEVAEYMGFSESKVKTSMHRTRQKLQEYLTKEYL